MLRKAHNSTITQGNTQGIYCVPYKLKLLCIVIKSSTELNIHKIMEAERRLCEKMHKAVLAGVLANNEKLGEFLLPTYIYALG